MFHRITLEAGKLQSASLVKPSKSAQSSSNTNDDNIPDEPAQNSYYEEVAQEAETFFRGNKLPLSFLVYLLLGSVFYHYDYRKKTADNGAVLEGTSVGRTNPVFGFYEVSITTWLYICLCVE